MQPHKADAYTCLHAHSEARTTQVEVRNLRRRPSGD